MAAGTCSFFACQNKVLLCSASRTDGRFNIPGIRVGGPYGITVSYIGYKTERQADIYLNLGADINISFVMIERAIELPSVIVTVAEKNAILTASHVGTVTNVSTAEIERLPTIQRTIDDFPPLTPSFRYSFSNTKLNMEIGRPKGPDASPKI